MSGANLPEDIVNYIFKFAFYPHQYPDEKYISFNKCLKELPVIHKQNTFIKHPIFTYPFIHFKHSLILFGKKILVDQCEVFKCNYYLME